MPENLTKRHLGLLAVLLGILILVVSTLSGSHGIGNAQKFALLGAALIIGIGLSLIPLGDQPA